MTMTMAGGVGGGPGTWNIYTCVPFGCGFKRHHLFWQPFGFGCLKTLVGDVISGTCITKNSDDGLQTVCLHMLLFFFSISQQQLFEKISDWTLVFRLSKKRKRIHVSLRIPIRYNLSKWVISGVISPLYSGIPMGMNP